MPFLNNEKELEIRDFKVKGGNSQVDEKKQTYDKFLFGNPEIIGDRGRFNKLAFLNSPCLPYFIHTHWGKYAKMNTIMAPFLNRVFFLSVLDFNYFCLKIVCMPGGTFWTDSIWTPTYSRGRKKWWCSILNVLFYNIGGFFSWKPIKCSLSCHFCCKSLPIVSCCCCFVFTTEKIHLKNPYSVYKILWISYSRPLHSDQLTLQAIFFVNS